MEKDQLLSGVEEGEMAEDGVLPSVFSWMKDDDVTHCCDCGVLFSFPWPRKHHCRRCGKIYCYKCSDNSVLLDQSLGYDSEQRVCNSCCDVIHAKSYRKEDFALNGDQWDFCEGDDPHVLWIESKDKIIDELKSSIVCGICQETIRSPLLLSCGHVLCKACVEENDSKHLDTRVWTCQDCGKHNPSISHSAQPDFLDLSISEIYHRPRLISEAIHVINSLEKSNFKKKLRVLSKVLTCERCNFIAENNHYFPCCSSFLCGRCHIHESMWCPFCYSESSYPVVIIPLERIITNVLLAIASLYGDIPFSSKNLCEPQRKMVQRSYAWIPFTSMDLPPALHHWFHEFTDTSENFIVSHCQKKFVPFYYFQSVGTLIASVEFKKNVTNSVVSSQSVEITREFSHSVRSSIDFPGEWGKLINKLGPWDLSSLVKLNSSIEYSNAEIELNTRSPSDIKKQCLGEITHHFSKWKRKEMKNVQHKTDLLLHDNHKNTVKHVHEVIRTKCVGILLLPIFFITLKHQGETHDILMNGANGFIAGDHPHY